MTDWRSLVERMACDDPLTSSQEGLDDGCFFCGADLIKYSDKWPNMDRYVEHESDCVWVEARWALGLPLGDHTVKP